MDRLVKKFSEDMAKTSSRRDFLASVGRAVVRAGLGAGLLFGTQSFAFADRNCKAGATVGCYGGATIWCPRGDSNGCGGLYKPGGGAQTYYCPTGDCAADGTCQTAAKGGNNPEDFGYWQCCCNKVLTTCRDCGPTPRRSPVCICLTTGGAC